MKISNEIKAKAIAPYLGQYGRHKFAGILKLRGILITDDGSWSVWLSGENHNGGESFGLGYDINDFLLTLRPLSAITDEDLDKCLELLMGRENWVTSHEDFKIQWRQVLRVEIKDGFGSVQMQIKPYFSQVMQLGQLLCRLGYDMKNALLDGKTLKEARLAVYE